MWHDLHVTADGRYIKCAAVVGEVMKSYHPHGDQSIYDALVRMAQPFSLRHPLVEGYGNFGSIDGDPPAAMRYTECRLTPIAEDAPERAARADGRLPAQLRLDDRGADRPARAVPEPAGQRGHGDRRRDGDEHPAAQPEGSLQRPGRPAGQPRAAAREAAQAHPRARLPDRRRDPEHGRRDPPDLRDRPGDDQAPRDLRARPREGRTPS